MSSSQSWSLSYGSWICNYLCCQCLSSLTVWVRIPLMRGVLDTTLYDKVCQWLATGWWFSPVFTTNKTDGHDKTDILLKVALNTITLTPLTLIRLAPELIPVVCGVRVARSLVFLILFCRLLFDIFTFFFLSFYYLSFRNLRDLITPLVSSNFSQIEK